MLAAVMSESTVISRRTGTVEDLLHECGEHARTAHGMAVIPEELLEKVKAAISG